MEVFFLVHRFTDKIHFNTDSGPSIFITGEIKIRVLNIIITFEILSGGIYRFNDMTPSLVQSSKHGFLNRKINSAQL